MRSVVDGIDSLEELRVGEGRVRRKALAVVGAACAGDCEIDVSRDGVMGIRSVAVRCRAGLEVGAAGGVTIVASVALLAVVGRRQLSLVVRVIGDDKGVSGQLGSGWGKSITRWTRLRVRTTSDIAVVARVTLLAILRRLKGVLAVAAHYHCSGVGRPG